MTDLHNQTFWKKCSTCKNEIPFQTKYYVCSVSTCSGKRTGFSFCSVECWDAHLGFANHRDADAIELRSLTKQEFLVSLEQAEEESQSKRILVRAEASNSAHSVSVDGDAEVLVVVSKVKKLIRDQSGFNTSQCAIDALTQSVVREIKRGIEKAKSNGRKTVMGRDFDF